MTDLAGRLAVGLLALLGFMLPVAVSWADELVIGHLEMKGDRDYRQSRTFAAFLTQPLGRPHAGGEVALGEVKWHGAATGTTFALDRQRARQDELVSTAEAMLARGIRFFGVAALLYLFGPPIRTFIEKSLNLLFVLFIILLLGGFYAVKFVM